MLARADWEALEPGIPAALRLGSGSCWGIQIRWDWNREVGQEGQAEAREELICGPR